METNFEWRCTPGELKSLCAPGTLQVWYDPGDYEVTLTFTDNIWVGRIFPDEDGKTSIDDISFSWSWGPWPLCWTIEEYNHNLEHWFYWRIVYPGGLWDYMDYFRPAGERPKVLQWRLTHFPEHPIYDWSER